MPLLEIAQTRRYVSAMIRVEETTAQRIDQYAAFMNSSADEVVDKALGYVFARDKDFQEYLQRPEAAHVAPSLRMRRATQNGSGSEPVNGHAKPANGSPVVDARPAKRSAGAE
jgi:hypothetical protein